MAVIKPETTGYGIYLIYFPTPIRPNIICRSPAKRNTNNIAGNAFSRSPSLMATILATTTILTAVIGAVGPEIWVLVPPNKAAKKLMNMAPYKPALGPIPELTPKAKAKGKATMPAVMPPNKSPLKFEKKFFINDLIVFLDSHISGGYPYNL